MPHLSLFSLLGALVAGSSDDHFSQVPAASSTFAWADFDGDGHKDAFVTGADGSGRLLRGLSDGSLEEATGVAGLGQLTGVTGAAWADFDSDGDPDLFLGSAATPSQLFENAEGTFVAARISVELPGGVRGAHWLDYDGDEDVDLLLHTGGGDLLLRNDLTAGTGFASVALPAVLAPVGAVGSVDGASTSRTGSKATSSSAFDRPRDGSSPNLPQVGTVGGTSSTNTTGVSVGASGSFCAQSIIDQGTGSCVMASSTPTQGMLYPLSQDLFVDSSTGYVGLGTTSPAGQLEVSSAGDTEVVIAGDADNDPSGEGDHARLVLTQDGGNTRSVVGYAASENHLKILTTSDNADIILDANGSGQPGEYDLKIDRNSGDVLLRSSLDLSSDDGDIEIAIRADVDNDFEGDHARLYLQQDGGQTSSFIGYANQENDLKIVTEDSGMDIVLHAGGTGLAGEYDVRIDSATGLVSVKHSLEIRGGADIVEGFDSSCGELEAGTVVVIDPANPGALTCSADAYDTKVAGVVSGAGGVAAGIKLGQDGMLDGDTPVAMTGRVYVKASAENGAIQPGDRLTTAALSGHAMRATDSERSDGAVIGKAMTSLDEDTGLVLVLVNLQ